MQIFNSQAITTYFKNQKPPDIKQLQITKKTYTDPLFPPNNKTLISKDEYGNFTEPIEGASFYHEFNEEIPNWKSELIWKRPSELPDNWILFDDELDFQKVFQGSLGDCYLIGAIKSLSKYPYLIRDKFRSWKYSRIGYYEIVLFINGQWQIVIVDDNFPYNKSLGKYEFAHSTNHTIWIMLLEKAWAKINGGYSNIIGGSSRDPLEALTSFPSQIIELEKEKSISELYNVIHLSLMKGAIITLSGANKNNIYAKTYKFKTNHCYSIIGSNCWKENDIYLIKLIDPTGNNEFCGNWGSKSNKWTKEMKKKFKYNPDTNPFEFFIDLETIKKVAKQIVVCHYYAYNVHTKYFRFNEAYNFYKPFIFKLSFLDKKDLSVSIYFKQRRFQRNIKKPKHPTTLVIFHYDNNNNVDDFFGTWDITNDIHLTTQMEKGNYIIWIYCAYNYVSLEEKENFSLTVVFRSLIKFKREFSGQDDKFELIHNLFTNYFNHVKRQTISKEYTCYSSIINESSDCGLFCRVLSNLLPEEKNKALLNVQTELFQNECFFTFPPYDNKSQISIDIPPMKTIIIISMQ
jgi:hypothetical protein